jgi:hypothetical protein
LIKATIHQDEITIVTIYTTSVSTPSFIQQMILAIKAERDPNTIIVGDFSIPLSLTDRSSRQNIDKKEKKENFKIKW